MLLFLLLLGALCLCNFLNIPACISDDAAVKQASPCRPHWTQAASADGWVKLRCRVIDPYGAACCCLLFIVYCCLSIWSSVVLVHAGSREHNSLHSAATADAGSEETGQGARAALHGLNKLGPRAHQGRPQCDPHTCRALQWGQRRRPGRPRGHGRRTHLPLASRAPVAVAPFAPVVAAAVTVATGAAAGVPLPHERQLQRRLLHLRHHPPLRPPTQRPPSNPQTLQNSREDMRSRLMAAPRDRRPANSCTSCTTCPSWSPSRACNATSLDR